MKRSIDERDDSQIQAPPSKKLGNEALYQAVNICPLDLILQSANETSEVNNKIKGQVLEEYQRLLTLEENQSQSSSKEQAILAAKQKVASGLNQMQKCYAQFSTFSQIFINSRTTKPQTQQTSCEQRNTVIPFSPDCNDGVIFDFTSNIPDNESSISNEESLLAQLTYSSTEEDDDDEEEASSSDDENEQAKATHAQQKLTSLKEEVKSTRNLILTLMEKVNKLESVS